ncbi:MAG: endonuclease [Alphaproteobacteria bacterium]|nr:endonuclease [Alphaproteobacteria bacterium]
MQLVSYNIQYGTGKDGRVDIDRIVSEIADGDVIAMQEVDRFWTRSEMADQVEALTKRLPEHHWVYGPGVDMDASDRDETGTLRRRRRQFGNLLLSRFPVLLSRNHLLPKMSFHSQLSIQRSALDGAIAFPDGPVRVASVHLAHAAELERVSQVATLRELQRVAGRDGGVLSGAHSHWCEEGPQHTMPKSSILLGDFNMTPAEQAYEAMVGPDDPKYGRITLADGYVDAWIESGGDPNGGHTKFEETGNRRIDYAFVSPDLADRIRDVRVDAVAQGSDHQPIWLDIDL